MPLSWGTIPDEKEKSADISGATVQAVIGSMYDAIQRLHRDIDEQEGHLQQALTKLQAFVRARMPDMLVTPPGEFTSLASADRETLRTTFIDR